MGLAAGDARGEALLDPHGDAQPAVERTHSTRGSSRSGVGGWTMIVDMRLQVPCQRRCRRRSWKEQEMAYA